MEDGIIIISRYPTMFLEKMRNIMKKCIIINSY